MFREWKARRVLKTYGRELYRKRAEYAELFLQREEASDEANTYYISRHLRFRRQVLLLMIIAVFAAAFTACAHFFGIEILGYNFRDFRTHTDVAREEHAGTGAQSGAVYYVPSYLPRGYHALSADGDDVRTYAYENKSGKTILLLESFSDSFRASVDNENCTHSREKRAGYECDIYRYEDGGRVYIFQKDGTVMMLQAEIGDGECERIIASLTADGSRASG